MSQMSSRSHVTLVVVALVAFWAGSSACSPADDRASQSPPSQLMPVPKRTNENAPAAPVGPVVPTITAADLKKRIDEGQKTTIVCVHSGLEEPRIKGAIDVDEDDVVEWAKKLPKDSFIAVYCSCPADQASNRSVLELRANGYENAVVIEKGVKAWVAAGYPVTGGKAPAAANKGL
jgi:rhodanese-related sulfurtransferase